MTEEGTDEQKDAGSEAPKQFSVSEDYATLVKRTSDASATLLSEGTPELAQIELIRTLTTGVAALVMLVEGQLKATAYLIDLQVRAQRE